jgi:hypothetical protein
MRKHRQPYRPSFVFQFLDATVRNFLNFGFTRKRATLQRSQSSNAPDQIPLIAPFFEPKVWPLCPVGGNGVISSIATAPRRSGPGRATTSGVNLNSL